MKRLLALLCAALLLVNTAFAEGVFTLPRELKVIEEEAFALPASSEENAISVDSADSIIVPEGTEEIRSRAFANNPASYIELPESLSFIADDAFEGCGNATLYVLRGSYAHEWCMAHDVRYAVLDAASDAAVYAVHSVETATDDSGATILRCVVTTMEACVLRVDVLDNAGENVVSTATAPVGAAQSNLTVDVAPSAALPRYYVLRAVLEDENGNELSEARTNSHYTSEYADFAQQTPEDFPEETVLDFGDSGFAVLADGVIPLRAEAAVNGNNYTFAASESLSAGDIVVLTVNGNETPVKIASVTDNGDGTVTIVKDENVYLSEMYDVINVDGIMVGDGVQAASDDITPLTVTPSGSVTYGLVTVSYSMSMTIRPFFNYDKEKFGNDYFEAGILVDTFGDITAFSGQKVDTWNENNSPRFDLYSTELKFPGIELDSPAYLEISLPLNIYAEIGGTASFGFSNHYGYHFNPRDGWTSVSDGDGSVNLDFNNKFSFKWGPEVSLNVNLFKAVEGRLSGQIGLLLEGAFDEPIVSGSLAAQDGSIPKYHACLSCLGMELFFDINVRGALSYELSDELSGDLVDVNVGLFKAKLGDYHRSIANSKDSIYGGEATFGKGTCPNYLYRAIIDTAEDNGNEITGISITVSGDKTTTSFGFSPYTTYLYPGVYTALANFETGDVSQDFTVSDSERYILLEEECVSISGTITDSETAKPITGATVTAILPDGTTQTATTGVTGSYHFYSLPIGEYSLTASMTKYKPVTNSGLSFPVAGDNIIDFNLEKGELTITGTITDSETGEPIPAASVVATLPDGSTRSAITGTNGVYRIDGLYAGEYSLTASATNYSSQTVSGLSIDADSTNTIDFALDKENVTVEGTVIDSATSEPVSGATVTAALPDGTTRTAYTFSDGAYRLENLPAGEYTLTASATGYGPDTRSGLSFNAGSVNTVNFSLIKGDVIIRGSVFDAQTYSLISGATITALLPDGTTQSIATGTNGTYRFENMPDGAYTLTASARGYSSQTRFDLNFESGSTNIVSFLMEECPPDADLMNLIWNSMGEDLLQRLDDAGYYLESAFTYFTPLYADEEGADDVLWTEIELGISSYLVTDGYVLDDALFREAQTAIIESGAFPLTDEDVALLKSELYTPENPSHNVDLDSGVEMSSFIYSTTPICRFTYKLPIDLDEYDNPWSSKWLWDQATYSGSNPPNA